MSVKVRVYSFFSGFVY